MKDAERFCALLFAGLLLFAATTFYSGVTNKAPSVSSELVRFNVGGQLFVTARQTILQYPDSYLAHLVAGKIPVVKDEQGSLFLDRNPEYFVCILDFLRYGIYHRTPRLDERRLTKEAQFYGVRGPQSWDEWGIDPISSLKLQRAYEDRQAQRAAALPSITPILNITRAVRLADPSMSVVFLTVTEEEFRKVIPNSNDYTARSETEFYNLRKFEVEFAKRTKCFFMPEVVKFQDETLLAWLQGEMQAELGRICSWSRIAPLESPWKVGEQRDVGRCKRPEEHCVPTLSC